MAMTANFTERLTVSLSPDVLQALQAVVDTAHRTVAQVVRSSASQPLASRQAQL
jgi:hypothetical protein